MIFYDHAMIGVSLALGAGLQRRYGWRVAGMAGFAAALPDWDGLSILLGPEAYATAHRVWGHNLLAATTLGGLTGAVDYRLKISSRVYRALAAVRGLALPKPGGVVLGNSGTVGGLIVWTVAGVVASLSHLATDLVYSWHPVLGIWPLPLLWPFSARAWAWPVVAWGDMGATVIFIGEMFALYRWPRRAQIIAAFALLAFGVYVGARWCASGVQNS